MLNNKQKEILLLSQRRARYEYLGILNEYQTIAEKHNEPIDYTKLNPKQHFLFKRVLHGLNIYDKSDVSKMHWDKKRRITKVWKRSQDIINEWKQYICYIICRRRGDLHGRYNRNHSLLYCCDGVDGADHSLSDDCHVVAKHNVVNKQT